MIALRRVHRPALKLRGRRRAAAAPSLLLYRSAASPSPSCNVQTRRDFATRHEAVGRFGRYIDDYSESLRDSRGYWMNAASELDWYQPPTLENALRTHPKSEYMHEWFTDGVLNTSYNCLDRHVLSGRGDQPALVYDSPVTDTKRTYTYSELLEEVAKFAAGLADLGVEVGDRVVIYMPMIPESVIAMLACARIGAIHSVVFGGFSAKELAHRIDDSQPKVIVSASGAVLPGGKVVPYKPLLEDALEKAQWKDVSRSVIVQRKRLECKLKEGDVSYQELMEGVNDTMDAVMVPSTHPHYILYTSGTTGMPKGVVHDTGGYATAMKWSMSKFYDTDPGDVFFAAADVGWAVGHSYTVYGPLIHGCTTILYEGKPVGTPDAGAFWRIVEEYGVNVLFSAPTSFRAVRQADPEGAMAKKHDLSSLRAVYAAGERSDPSTLHWMEDILGGVPAIDHWWQTELGYPGAGNALGLGKIAPRHGACAAAVPGYDIRAFDDDGKELPPNSLGSLAIKLPLPPGTLPTLYNNDERYISEYLSKFPGYYDTMDAGVVDEDGYVSIMARTDDIICTAGYRLSTGALEEILMDHQEVTDAAVIGVRDKLKGEVPVGFVVVSEEKEGLINELVSHVREKLGSHANLKKVAIVRALPKTRSGKVLRGTMRKIANGEDYVVTPTIEDPNIFEELKPVITKLVNK
ncbi:hypothetical protein ACHAXT_001893 [Thalassiosira profunda]